MRFKYFKYSYWFNSRPTDDTKNDIFDKENMNNMSIPQRKKLIEKKTESLEDFDKYMDNFTKSILGDKSNINVSQENTKKSSDDDLDLDLDLNMDLDLDLNMGKNLSNNGKRRRIKSSMDSIKRYNMSKMWRMC